MKDLVKNDQRSFPRHWRCPIHYGQQPPGRFNHNYCHYCPHYRHRRCHDRLFLTVMTLWKRRCAFRDEPNSVLGPWTPTTMLKRPVDCYRPLIPTSSSSETVFCQTRHRRCYGRPKREGRTTMERQEDVCSTGEKGGIERNGG